MESGIVAGTPFDKLPGEYNCPLCEGPKADFIKISGAQLGLQPI
jgi:rubredoxin